MKEDWKQIANTNGKYDASNLGQIRSYLGSGRYSKKTIRSNPKILKSFLSVDGYPRVTIIRNGKRRQFSVHILVLEAFRGQRPEKFEGAHLDGNPQNNKIENLKWCSAKENSSHKKLHGTQPRGEKCSLAKITDICILAIKHKKSIGWTNIQISKYYGISYRHACHLNPKQSKTISSSNYPLKPQLGYHL